MIAVVLTLALPAIAAVVAAVSWPRRRRLDFAATIRRHHPELGAALDVDEGPVGAVAAQAVDLPTPGAPRELRGWELS